MDIVWAVLKYLWDGIVATVGTAVFFAPFMLLAGIMQFITTQLSIQCGEILGGKLWKVIAAPGIIFHECSHALFCLIFRNEIEEIKLISFSDDKYAGYVKHRYDPENVYQTSGHFFIGVAPILCGVIFITLLTRYLMGSSVAAVPDQQYTSLVQVGQQTLSAYLDMIRSLAAPEIFMRWEAVVWLLVLFLIGSQVTLSKEDLQGAENGFCQIMGLVLLYHLILVRWNPIPKLLFRWCGNFLMSGCCYMMVILTLLAAIFIVIYCLRCFVRIFRFRKGSLLVRCRAIFGGNRGVNRNIEEIIHLEEVANEADDAEDYSTAFENYRILAEKYENSNAQYLLGFYYQEGLGTAQNIFAAERWFRRSAAQGNQVALDALGGIYYSGEIGFTDYKKAFKYFKKAACRELPEVYEKLGHCYRLGHGVRVNKKRAFENYSRFYEADPNLDRAKLYMGLCFCDGIGVAADYDKGIAYLSEMDKIDPEAQYVLGKCLLGKGDAYGAAKALLCADAADLEVEPYLDQALDRLSEAQLDALFKECDSVKAGDDADDDYDDTDDSDDVDDDDDDDDDDDTDSGSRRHQSYSLGSKAYSNDITFSV